MATENDVRRIALALPETTEKPWFNSPGFRVKELRELIHESWRIKAPKTVLKKFGDQVK